MSPLVEPTDFLPLKPLEFHALLALADEELHGYGIKKSMAQRTDGAIDPEPGTLYRLMARLLKQGLISESERRPAPESDGQFTGDPAPSACDNKMF